jgi:hypothetical protein
MRKALKGRFPALVPVVRKVRAIASLLRERTLFRALGFQEGAATFTHIFQRNLWGNSESASGPGSTLAATRTIRERLPALASRYGVRSVLDVPCGDFNWMQHVNWSLERYVGGDLVEPLIDMLQREHADEHRTFRVLNLTTDIPEAVDLVLVRDLFIHLPFNAISRALANIKASRSRYLLTTTYPEWATNSDIAYGGFRPVNLQLQPFCLPSALETIPDHDYLDADLVASGKRPRRHGEPWGRCLALWRIADLP